jgi:hypothetical protein
VDQFDIQVVTESFEHLTFKRAAIIEDHLFGNDLPLTHGRDHRLDGRLGGNFPEEVAKHTAPRVVIEQGQVKGLAGTDAPKGDNVHIIAESCNLIRSSRFDISEFQLGFCSAFGPNVTPTAEFRSGSSSLNLMTFLSIVSRVRVIVLSSP